MPVIYNGYCRPLKAKVDFEVSEVNSLDTAKGIKWQVKGKHGEHNISVFASETNARDLLTQLDATKVESFDAEIAYIPPEEVMVYESEELVPNFFLGAESFNAEEKIDTEEEEYRWRDELSVSGLGYGDANQMLHDEIRTAGEEEKWLKQFDTDDLEKCNVDVDTAISLIASYRVARGDYLRKRGPMEAIIEALDTINQPHIDDDSYVLKMVKEILVEGSNYDDGSIHADSIFMALDIIKEPDIDDDSYILGEVKDILQRATSKSAETFNAEAEDKEEDVDYSKMTVKQLKVELKARGLKVSGKKAELIERLQSEPLSAESDFTHAIEDEESFERKFQDDIFDNEEDAMKRATEIGCEKVHSHIIDGKTVYMPCHSHAEYESAMGMRAENEMFNALSFSDWADQEMQTHGEDVSFDEWVDDESTKHGNETFDDWADHERESHANRYNAEEAVLTNAEIPPLLYEDYIPPEVWNSISDSARERYIETKDESVLICPKCGVSKKGLRKIEGFCVATEYASPYYQEGVDCPYSKMFSPIHWISPENEYSEGFEDSVTDRLMVQMEVMGAESPITLHSPTPVVKDTFETDKITISNETYNDIYEDLPESASIGYSKDGRSINIGYFKEDEQYITRLIEASGEIMEEENEGMEMYSAEDVMTHKSARRKSFYMNALDAMDRMYDAEDDDDDELDSFIQEAEDDDDDDLGPFSQEAETINQINPTIVEGSEDIMGAETLEFHEEELYTVGDEMDEFLKPMIDDLAQQQGYSDFDEFDRDVERRSQMANQGRLDEAPPLPNPRNMGDSRSPEFYARVGKKEGRNRKLLVGLLALGSAAVSLLFTS